MVGEYTQTDLSLSARGAVQLPEDGTTELPQDTMTTAFSPSAPQPAQDINTAVLIENLHADTSSFNSNLSQDYPRSPTNANVLQDADTEIIEDMATQASVSGDVWVSDPQLGTVQVLHDACIIDSCSQSGSVSHHKIHTDDFVAREEEEYDDDDDDDDVVYI